MFVKIGNGALLPRKLSDKKNDSWTGSRDDIREIGSEPHLNPLTNVPPMLWWTITHDVQNASFSIISPMDFQHRAIIVPPQGIYIDRKLKGTGMVKRMQGILEQVAQYNNACLGALVETHKLETVGPDMESAGYRVLGEKGCCSVFVHNDSKNRVDHLVQALDINS